jgi:5-methylcytosine-specific restriction endonuclease McrA
MERITITKNEQLQVFKRDNWTCKYCGDSVFFGPTLKLLEEISPGQGYYHPRGKSGEMLKLFRTKLASVDHINPVSKGGQNDIANYATACWDCNVSLNDKVENKPSPDKINQDNIESNWDGLVSLYPKLTKKNNSWVKLIRDSLA